MPKQLRTDEAWYASVLRENFIAKFTIVVFGIVCLFLGGACFVLLNRTQPPYVFDSTTGKTYTTQRISNDMWDNLLIAASRDFMSDFLNYDHSYIEHARSRAFGRLTPLAQKRLKDIIANPQTILAVVRGHQTSTIRFIQPPRVILRAGTEFRTFCITEVTIVNDAGVETKKQANWKLSWFRHQSTPDRPDGLWLSNVEPVGADELNDILNTIK